MVNEILSGAKSVDMKLGCEDINQHAFISPQSMNHSITTILNLPIELKQKIAMKLSAKDYASFRESCLKISQDIDDFSILNSKVTSGYCTQKYEDDIKKILLNQSVRMIIHHHEGEDISKVLGNVCISKLKSANGGGLFMRTAFSTRKMKIVSGNEIDNPYPYWINKSFMLFKDEFSKVVDNSKIKIKIEINQRKNNSFIPWVVGVELTNEFICYSQLKTVFITLGHAFKRASCVEKLLIAIFADELKSFWCKHIPHGLVKANIAESAREVADLFKVANEVRRILQENSH